jgi:hypothetical protein
VTPDQQAMVAFAMRWEPYGGGDDEILPLFGIPVHEFYRRVCDLVETPSNSQLDEVTRNRLRTFCTTKLTQIALHSGADRLPRHSSQRRSPPAPPR